MTVFCAGFRTLDFRSSLWGSTCARRVEIRGALHAGRNSPGSTKGSAAQYQKMGRTWERTRERGRLAVLGGKGGGLDIPSGE